MEVQTQEIATTRDEKSSVVPASIYTNPEGFNGWLKMAEALSKSTMVPQTYRGTPGMANCLIALEMANRLGESPFVMMQNMDVVKGKPFFAAKYLAARINGCGKYSPIRFDLEELGETNAVHVTWVGQQGQKKPKETKIKIHNIRCRARCTELSTGEELAGDWVSIEMAVNEGWYTKAGSKWPTMPHKMLRYRATSFWVNIFDPGINMGIQTPEEIQDVEFVDESSTVADLNGETQTVVLDDKVEPDDKLKDPDNEII